MLLDLKSLCVLSESFLGYQKISGGVEVSSAAALPRATSRFPTLVVPAAGILDSASVRVLYDHLQAGGVVLLESGGGYLRPDEFSVHQQMLKRHLNVSVGMPVDLWSGARASCSGAEMPSQRKVAAHGSAPYIDFLWPLKTKVRDFSRVVPPTAQDGDVIGVARKIPVAIRKRVGKGTLIFLGSPIGPHLYAGDPEATRWLHAVLSV